METREMVMEEKQDVDGKSITAKENGLKLTYYQPDTDTCQLKKNREQN